MEDIERVPTDCQGFTLIELLVMIVLLGVLAAVVVFATGGAATSANGAACRVERRTVVAASEGYEAAMGSSPTMSELVAGKWLESASTNYGVDGSALPGGEC